MRFSPKRASGRRDERSVFFKDCFFIIAGSIGAWVSKERVQQRTSGAFHEFHKAQISKEEDDINTQRDGEKRDIIRLWNKMHIVTDPNKQTGKSCRRSGLKLTHGVIVTLKIPGRVVRTIPISVFEAPRLRRCNGRMLGTTASMNVKQKSPTAANQKERSGPAWCKSTSHTSKFSLQHS